MIGAGQTRFILGIAALGPRAVLGAVAGRPRAIRGAAILALALAGLATAVRPAGASIEAVHNCRFWALIGQGYPADLITDHLRDGTEENLMNLGASNDDGWGIAYFPPDSAGVPLQMPVIRRGGPHAAHPYEPEYLLTVGEMAAAAPKAAIAHVRIGTSGHSGIPNPHPFLHQGKVFAHNGGAREAGLEDYLDKYLTGHPPDYRRGVTGTGHIDSELLFLGLLKYADDHPALPFAETLAAAVAAFAADPQITGGAPRLNFVMTCGDTLYALHYFGTGASNPLVYAPQGPSPYWAVASEPLGSGTLTWSEIPARTLAVFVPGEAPVFLEIGEQADEKRLGAAAARNAARGAGAGGRRRKGADQPARVEPPQGGGGQDESGAAGSPLPPTAPAEHNCRFWSVVGNDYPPEMVTDHLWNGSSQNLRELGEANADGWGIGAIPSTAWNLPLQHPLIRRGGPSARNRHEAEYRLAVEELAALLPPAAIAHVRRGTSGHFGIPDPHPFQHRGILFAHNGGLDAGELEERLGPAFLQENPPDYTAGEPGTGPVDSELYLLYLLKLIDERPGDGFTSALLAAVRTIVADDELHDEWEQLLNFVLTRGDTLYALQHYGPGYNFEHYYPAAEARAASNSPFWVVASESLGSGEGGWAPIPEATLAVFVPGEAPQFLSLTEQELSLGAVWVTATGDADGDGFFTQLEVCADPDAPGGSISVSVALSLSADGETWTPVGSTRYRPISGTAADTLCLEARSGSVFWPDSLPPAYWEASNEIYTRESPDPVLVVSSDTHPDWGLGEIPVEGSDQDQPVLPETPAIGRLYPNPTTGALRIPVELPGEAQAVRLELYSLDGQLLWRGVCEVAGGAVSWSEAEAGVRLHSGAYAARLAFGEQEWVRRLIVVR